MLEFGFKQSDSRVQGLFHFTIHVLFKGQHDSLLVFRRMHGREGKVPNGETEQGNQTPFAGHGLY